MRCCFWRLFLLIKENYGLLSEQAFFAVWDKNR